MEKDAGDVPVVVREGQAAIVGATRGVARVVLVDLMSAFAIHLRIGFVVVLIKHKA